MKKRITRVSVLFIAIMVMFSMSSMMFVFATDDQQPIATDDQQTTAPTPSEVVLKTAGITSVTLVSATDTGNTTTLGESKHFIGDFTASKKGEKYFAASSCEKSCQISGTISISIASKVIATIGFDYTEKQTVTAGATSASLNKGQKVDAYAQPKYREYKVRQKYTNPVSGTWYKTAYIYKPVTESVSFVYH